MSVTDETPATESSDSFRWQALFQRSQDALFVLNARSRLLFVNRAWEQLVGLPLGEVRGRYCRRKRPVGAELADPPQRERKILAHALTPPDEVWAGSSVRTRRLLPAGRRPRRWWEVDFLPLRDGEGRVLAIVGRVVQLPSQGPLTPLNLPERIITLRERVLQRSSLDWFGISTPALQRLTEQVRLGAGVNVPVLFVGEAGTGKQTLARILHALSPARERSLACLDCERLPLTLLADLLFAPEGVTAQGVGTVYLREPGLLPGEIQTRLLDLVRAGGYLRVLTGCREFPGRLIEPLACALSPLRVDVPPLRSCRAELPRRIESGLERLAERDGRLIVEVAPEALAILADHSWPGNTRELFEVLAAARERVKGERIEAEHLPLRIRLPQTLQRTPRPVAAGSLPLDTLLEETERKLIELALERARGNKTRAAEMLGIWRERLGRRLKALGIADPETVPPGEIQLEPD